MTIRTAITLGAQLFVVAMAVLPSTAGAEQGDPKPMEIRTLYSENGKAAEGVSPANIVTAKVPGQKSPSPWAVGKDGKFYAVNEPRSTAEFDKARGLFLADAVAQFAKSKAGTPKASGSCSHSTTYNCVGTEQYACVHTVCYRCWIEYTWGSNGMVPHTVCGSQTDDISCEPTGGACAK